MTPATLTIVPKAKPVRKLKILHYVTPNTRTNTPEWVIGALWIFLMVFMWVVRGASYLPTPMDVIRAFPHLWFSEGLGVQLYNSMALNLQAITIMFVISYTLSVLTVTPLFSPLAKIVSLGRFNGFVGLPLVFMSILHNTHSVKVALLVFGMGVFTILSLVKMIDNIPKENYDHARTLRNGEWRVVWEVVILGTLDQVIDILRINIAMGWMMLPMVEARFKNEGGIGALMEVENKHLNLDMVFCALFVIMIVGFCQDWVITIFKKLTCPYSELGMERA